MKHIICMALGLLLLVVSGCGTTGLSRTNQQELGYIMVSKGKASGAAKLIGGGADFCKATQYNLDGIKFAGAIVYAEDTCRVEITSTDQ